jgi:tetratricopeptide (TPR) repeat protein
MKPSRRIWIAGIVFALAAGVANASWYDDYEAGVKAARAGNWNVVVQKMSAAISAKPKENNRERTYGAIFINYHPYYYRGVANMQLGRYDQAISDLETTTGPGEFDMGSIDTLITQAKEKQADARSPAPSPPSPVPQPQPTTPTRPTIDPGMRSRAQAEIDEAERKMGAAQARRAGSAPTFSQGLSAIAEANNRLASARTNEDLNGVIATAKNAGLFFDAAQAPAIIPTPVPTTPATRPGTPPPLTPGTRPAGAGEAILAEYQTQLRRALQNYFAGEFEEASKDFKELSEAMPRNAWIWAFLGASQYSLYAFEIEDQYRVAAMESFRKARSLRTWQGGLPERYFSRRIRNVFNGAG